MSTTKFKSIRENYSMLLATFKDAGIKLSESQKKDIDQFVLALEDKIESTKQKTILATKKVVEKRMEAEYKPVIESIIKNLAKNAELAGKIQDKVTSIKESKKMAVQLDKYLDAYVGEILPEQQIVDYTKMRGMKSEISSLKKQLTESKNKEHALQVLVDKAKADRFVELKTQDLPLFEARQIKKRLAGSTLEEAKKNFKSVLESVQEDMEKQEIADSLCLEKEIDAIIKDEEIKTEQKKEFDKTADEEKLNETEDITSTENQVSEADEVEEIVDIEESESYEFEETEDCYGKHCSLSESEKINSNMMKYWISTSKNIVKNL